VLRRGNYLNLVLTTGLVLSALAGPAQGQSPANAVGPKDTLVYIGTRGDEGMGIHVFRLQSAGTEVFQNVTLVPLGLAAKAPSPTFFELDTKRRRLFAVSEIDTFEGQPSGAVTAYAIDTAGKLTLLNQRASMGTRPCHLALDKDARNVLVANCGSGTITVFPVAADGQLGPATDSEHSAGRSAPCVAVDPTGRFAFTCDASADKITTYLFDAERGQLTAKPSGSISLKPGSDPRDLTFRPDGRFAYVLNSKTSTVTTFAYDDSNGTLTEVQTVTTLPEYFDGPNTAGELRMHRTGKWLYASNVGHNSVVLFTTDFEKGTLTFVEEQGTGGKTPVHFGIEPSSKHLAISNTDSNTVLASRIDEGNGRLKPSGIFASVPSPASIRFLPPLDQGTSK
jgi:6-phosphogluconolactonase